MCIHICIYIYIYLHIYIHNRYTVRAGRRKGKSSIGFLAASDKDNY